MSVPYIRLHLANGHKPSGGRRRLSVLCCLLVVMFMSRSFAVLARLAPAPENKPPTGSSSRSEYLTQGGLIYRRSCQMCHGEGGLGKSALGPALLESIWLRTCSAEQISAVLLYGVMGPLPGTQARHPIMPGFGNWLSDAEVADVATYTVQIWGRRHLPVSPQLVASIRAEHGKSQKPWTLDELQKRYPVGSTWPLAGPL